MEIVACVSFGELSDALLQFHMASVQRYCVASLPSTLSRAKPERL